MQAFCLVSKKATGNANSRVVKTKGRLQMKSILQYVATEKVDLLHKDLVYLIYWV